MRVVVIGGGLAGIAAALELADAGAEVTVLEARGWLGGATFSIERDGLWLDNGQHIFMRCCTAYRELLRRLEVEHLVTLQDRLDVPVLAPDGRFGHLRRSGLPAPLQLGAALARYPFLSPREKLGLLRPVLALRRLELDDPSLDERAFGEWLEAHGQGPRAVEALWDLIALPTVNLPAAEASLAVAAMVFKVGLLEAAGAADIGYALAPLQRVHGDAAAARLGLAGVDVRVKARVEAIAPLETGIAVSWSGGSLSADCVVLAVPHDDAATLLPAGALPAGVEPSRLGRSPIVNIHVGYDRRVMHHPFAAGIGSPVQFVFDRTASSGLRNGQLLAISISGADEYAGSGTDELRALFIPALAALFPAAAAAEVTMFFVTREPAATFRAAPGSARDRPGTRTTHPRLFLAGAWTDTGWPATMEGAVRSGFAAAQAVATEVGRTGRRLAA